MKNIKTIIICIAIVFLQNFTYAQDKSYVSSKNVVTKANGTSTNITIQKTMYIEISVDKTCDGYNCGRINIADGPMHTGKHINFEGFRIYSIKLKDDGKYSYWTVDVAADGQIVLFQVDNNSAISTITMHRYAPGQKNEILKSVVYYLD
jgi:hypothetical protein